MIAALVFPHQLFLPSPLLKKAPDCVIVVEDSLWFGDAEYPAQFHKQRLAFLRASLDGYAQHLERSGYSVRRLGYESSECQLPGLCRDLERQGFTELHVLDVTDDVLERRLERAAQGLVLRRLPTPGFINTRDDNEGYRASRSRWFMADFYAWQRKRLDLLMDGDKPKGGKFSFDEDNRRKLPKKEHANIPALPAVPMTDSIRAAVSSVEEQFPDNPGSLASWYYPTDHAGAERWFDDFLAQRFSKFGPYEDAMVGGQNWLYHSVLTPLLNTGLLTPQWVVERALAYAETHEVPLNSLEGFLRQIIGWREFMRATYEDLGGTMRTGNHWNHTRDLPACFYTATTGIEPVDDVLRRVLDTGYCHHIERLMVLGGFMFLCELKPDDIYTWFMEMFIDSNDWVMVPNVYAMSQNADGGHITTKPYFSGSNYVLKMSDYSKGEWCEIWDALFWRWIGKHADELAGNRRWSMMVANARRMPEEKMQAHVSTADRYLMSLNGR